MLFKKEQKELNPRIKAVMEKSGFSERKARKAMDRARELGLSYRKFLKYEAWNMNEEEIAALAERLRLRAERRARNTAAVCEATGWEKDKAWAALKEGKAAGVSYFQYILKSAYDLNHEELLELASELKISRERRQANYDHFIDTVCRKSGWERAYAVKKMQHAKSLGISYLKFIQKACWRFDDDEDLIALGEAVTEYKEDIKENKALYVEKIMAATGWSRGKTELEVLKAKNIIGSTYEDFYVFKFYELTPEEQAEYVTLDLFSKMRMKYNNYVPAATFFDDKANFNETFDDLINRKWFVNIDLSYEDFLADISGLNALLVKPLTATQGKGIEKVYCNVSDEENRKLYDYLMELDESIIEEYIIQNEEVSAFCSESVNTLRITTLNADGKCHFLYSVFRMGQGAVVDNFHAGGIAASVDVETGVVYTDAVDLEGNVYPVHPVSGLTIKGFKIPNWDAIISTCQKAYDRVDGVGLIGWDFAITATGVDLIEGNPGASYVVAQIPNVPTRQGLRKTMVDPYL